MKIKVFVDWIEQEVISEAEHKERIRQETESLMTDKVCFYDWLENNYSLQDIWEITEAERIKVQGLWERECKDTAENESGFEMIEIEI